MTSFMYQANCEGEWVISWSEQLPKGTEADVQNVTEIKQDDIKIEDKDTRLGKIIPVGMGVKGMSVDTLEWLNKRDSVLVEKAEVVKDDAVKIG
jgi:hypothetical protein